MCNMLDTSLDMTSSLWTNVQLDTLILYDAEAHKIYFASHRSNHMPILSTWSILQFSWYLFKCISASSTVWLYWSIALSSNEYVSVEDVFPVFVSEILRVFQSFSETLSAALEKQVWLWASLQLWMECTNQFLEQPVFNQTSMKLSTVS